MMYRIVPATLFALLALPSAANAKVTETDVDSAIRACSGGRHVEIIGDLSVGAKSLTKLFAAEGKVSATEVGAILEQVVETGDYSIYVSCVKDLLEQFDQATLDPPEHRSAEEGLKAVKGEIYTIIDGEVELIVKKMGQKTSSRRPWAGVYIDPPVVRPYYFGGLTKGTTKDFEYRHNKYRLRVLDVDLYEDTAILDIVKIQ